MRAGRRLPVTGPPARTAARRRAGGGHDFALLWTSAWLAQVAAQSVLTLFPLIALLREHADTAVVGDLNAAQYLPVVAMFLLAGPALAGRHRPLISVTCLVRAVVLALLAALGAAGFLSGTLITAAFLLGSLSVLFDLACQVHVPRIVPAEQLLTANGRLQATVSLAQVVGPGFAGVLVGFGGPRAALLTVAALFLLAGAVAAAMRRRAEPEAATEAVARATRSRSQIRAGIAVMRREPALIWTSVQAGWFNMFEQAILTLYLAYGAHTLGLGASGVGLSISVGGVGTLLGAMACGRFGARIVGPRLMSGSLGLACLAPALIPVAGATAHGRLALVGFAFMVYGFGLTVYGVLAVSLRQRLVGLDLLGQVTATSRTLSFGPIPLGALLGGLLGRAIAPGTAILVCVAFMLLGWAVFARLLVPQHGRIAACLVRSERPRPADESDAVSAPAARAGTAD